MSELSDPIENLSVRISQNGTPLGSGFVIYHASDPNFAYIMTALHCLDGLISGNDISIDTFDYVNGSLKNHVIEKHEFLILSLGKNRSELCLIQVPRQRLAFEINEVQIRTNPSKGQIYRFRGFPNAHQNQKPEELIASHVQKLGPSFTVTSDSFLEDNSSIASSNVKGFSGSGVYQINSENVELCGIVTHYTAFQRFEVCPFALLTELLTQAKISTWNILPALADASTQAKITTSTAYYELSSKFFENAEHLIEQLKPNQALNILSTALIQIKKDPIAEQDKKALLARLYFLQGLAKNDIELKNESYEALIMAYRLFPSNPDYQERAAISLLKTEKKREALEIAEKIISIDQQSPRAWAVISQILPNIKVPERVSDNPIFKVLTISFWPSHDLLIAISDFAPLFKKDSERRILPPSHIPRSQLYYWFYLAQFTFFDFLTNSLKTHSIKRYEHLENADELKYACELYKAVLERVDGTELKDQKTLRLCQIDYLFCNYFLKNDKTAVLRAYDIFIAEGFDPLPFKQLTPLSESAPNRAFDLLICLLQTNETAKALKVLETYTQPFEPYVYLFKAYAKEQEGEKGESRTLYKEYLSRTVNIGEQEFNNFCDVIIKLKDLGETNKILLNLCVTDKSFENLYYEDLLSAFILLESSEDKQHVTDLCELVFRDHKQHISKGVKIILAFLFFKVGHPSKTVELLANELDFNNDSQEHKIYILAYWQTGKDFKAIFNLLNNWRQNLPPDHQLAEIELNLYHELRNHTQVEEVARYGISHFPENLIYKIRLIDSLNWQGKRDEIGNLFNSIYQKRAELPWRTLFQLGNTCFVNDMYEEGLEFYYYTLKREISNPLIQEAYFINLSSYSKLDEMPYPESSLEGMVVRVQIDNSEMVIELTSDEIKYKPFVKNLLGRRLHEQFTYRDSLTGRTKNYTVNQILDKYRGQFALFTNRIAGSPEEGIHVRSISFDSANPDSLLENMQEILGDVGTERKILKDTYLKRFRDREVGFTQLYRNVFNDDPLSAWQYVTSRNSDGLPVVPMIHQPNWNIDSSCEFVLDFSSLFTLFHISGNENITVFDKPFIISQILKDYIQSEILESEIKRRAYVNVEVSREGIVPFFLSEQEVDIQIQLYRNLLTWINAHCATDFEPAILSVKRDRRFESKEIDFHHLCAIDTLLLATRENRFLLSDDLMVYQNKKEIVKALTLEHFLARFHQQAHSRQYSFDLIKLNYRGLTLTSVHLMKCFEANQLLINARSDFYLALNSFSVIHNPYGGNIRQLLTFVRDIYLGNLELQFKRQISSSVLQHFLVDLEITLEVVTVLENDINQLFFLMGDHLIYIKEDLLGVLEVLTRGINKD
jgi:tetratricopeptide (TPR) repeat protein